MCLLDVAYDCTAALGRAVQLKLRNFTLFEAKKQVDFAGWVLVPKAGISGVSAAPSVHKKLP